MEKIGLIAGNRRFPLFLAEAAKKKGFYIVAVAIKGETTVSLCRYVDKIYWLSLSDFRRCIEIFKSEGITKLVMAGQVSPRRLFTKEIDKSSDLREILVALKDKRADSIFGAIAEKLEEKGLALIDSTLFLKDLLPQKGILTQKQPDFSTWEDIYFGWELAKEIAFLDIGQTVAVKDKAIVAVEALEGTDNLIRRAARIAGSGITIVKVAKPRQDSRFDIPVVGLTTIKNLIKIRARCLALEAGKTLFLDQKKGKALAEKKGLIIVAV
ncbi:MAG: UDP-2,3-diacylglucosamine diphosphatase LpxI [Candidatus Omnitrophica bacterium]|nr:UDP-2,3-diacylglucosamine diphosphatase LpxI [Candidatus Omnitrophota bacterium]